MSIQAIDYRKKDSERREAGSFFEKKEDSSLQITRSGVFNTKGEFIYGRYVNQNGDYYETGRVDDSYGVHFIPTDTDVVELHHNDGSVFYIGQVNNKCMPEGKGREVGMKNGKQSCCFEGSYKEGKRNGIGKKFAEDAMSYEECNWINGKKDGTLPQMAREMYKRLFSDNQIPEGFSYHHYGEINPKLSKGITLFKGFVDSNGKKVAGQVYSNDNLNRLLYEGHFQDEKYHGKGKLLITHRYSFEGDFNQGCMIRGILSVDTIPIYEGEVNAHGEMNGRGKVYYVGAKKSEDRRVMVDGTFKDNKVDGFARVYYHSGQLKYCGYFVDGKINGKGLLFGENGSFLVGYDEQRNDVKTLLDHFMGLTEAEDIVKGTIDEQKGMVECWKNGELVGEVPIMTVYGCCHVTFKENKPIFIRDYVPDQGWMYSGVVREATENETNVIDLGMMKIVMEGRVDVYNNSGKYAECIFKSNVQDGPCRLFLQGSLFYDGEAYGLFPQGNGKRLVDNNVLMDGWFDKGELKRGMVLVKGKFRFSGELTNGISYQVNLVDKVSGRGLWEMIGSSDVFEGDIVENVCEGDGVLKKRVNGTEEIVYKGQWKNNMYHGQGRQYDGKRVYEGIFEYSKYISGRTLDYSIQKDGCDCEVTEVVKVSNRQQSLDMSLVYELKEKKNERVYVKLVRCVNNVESGLYNDQSSVRMATYKNGILEGVCKWYACSPEQLDQVFTSQDLNTDARIKPLRLIRKILYTGGRRNGEEEYYRMDGSIVYYDNGTKKGRISLNGNDIYVGDMIQKADLRDPLSDNIVANGCGVGMCPDGSYEGQWKDGKRHGEGVLTYSDGQKLQGIWIDDKVDGMATLWDRNGKQLKKYRMGVDTGYVEYETEKEKYTLESNEKGEIQMEVRNKTSGRIKYKGGVIKRDKAIEELKPLASKSAWYRTKSAEEVYDGYVLKWLEAGAMKTPYTDQMVSMSLPYHVNTFIPHGIGTETDKKGKVCYVGDFRYGVREGKGKEINGEMCLYDGMWSYNMRHGEGRFLVDPTGVYADCLFEMNTKKEQYALYLNDILVFKGSFDKEWKPSKGTFYIPISDVLLSIDTKVSKLSPDKEVELKEGRVSYVGPVKLDTNNLLVPFGSGTLTIGVKVYKGRFINNRDIDSCLVYENGQPVFDGSIRNLQYNVGVKYYPSGAKEEGFFKNGSLENGYRWDKDGRSVAVKGATRYEEYYKKINGTYRVGKPNQDSTDLGNISTGVGSKRVPIERSNSIRNIPLPPGMLKSKRGNSGFTDAMNALSASQRQIKEEVVEDNDKGKDDSYYLVNNEIRMSGSSEKPKNAFLENGYIYIPVEGKLHTYCKYVDMAKSGRYYYLNTVSRR